MTLPLNGLMSDGLAAPLGSVIAAVGRGVAEAQAALDAASVAQTLAMYESDGDPGLELLRDIGYQPTFYALPETVCEMQVSLTVGGSGAPDGAAQPSLAPAVLPSSPQWSRTGPVADVLKSRTYITPVDAGFANRYGYQAQAAARLTFKVAPVPPPAGINDARPIPDLVGLTFAGAEATLARRDLKAEAVTTGGDPAPATGRDARHVLAQAPAAGAIIPIGTAVVLTLG